MTISKELMLAILSLDSYNRGYLAGIDGIGSDVGNAHAIPLDSLKVSPEQYATWQADGFYAVAYDMTGVSGFESGQKVISFRGTDSPDPLSGASDLWNGWTIGAGFSGASQAGLAIQFYESVTGQSVFDQEDPTGTIVTGHSLVGGLAGFISALSGAEGRGFDYMPFVIAAWDATIAEVKSSLGLPPLKWSSQK